ncbi:GDSL-type esterase/lipase family protein [Komagataeibacter xylinus]|uniref:GDSL-type esterase/lipase family protein n=1 Tax=Komagataeibacter xylinus TaxID=28448 RepID=UPI001330FA42
MAVINAGISAAQLLRDGMGANALARLDREVLAQPGARALVFKLGTNDIGFPGTPFMRDVSLPSFETMVQTYKMITARAHAAGIHVTASTIAPFAGALPDTPFAGHYHTPPKETLRRRLNTWIRNAEIFDAVADFAAVLAERDAPERMAPQFDSGDHLHPNDKGNRAMANAFSFTGLTGHGNGPSAT